VLVAALAVIVEMVFDAGCNNAGVGVLPTDDFLLISRTTGSHLANIERMYV